MFVMMNAARLGVGVQGVAIAERAFQQALAFSQERRQGRAVWSSEYPAEIYAHPDVRRMLMLMKAKTEAARAICLTTGVLSDIARLADSEEERAAAKARAELLTPIAKAWSTDIGVEVASLGVQVHGGMGFIEETGAAQHYRDARIAPIYEGTNGIQAIDLVGRKVRMADGAVMRSLCDELALTAASLTEVAELATVWAASYCRPCCSGAGHRLDLGQRRRPKSGGGHALPEIGRRRDRRGHARARRQVGRRRVRRSLAARQGRAGSGLRRSRVLTQPGIAEGLMDGADDLETTSAMALAS